MEKNPISIFELCHYQMVTIKGQLISKGHFGILNSSKKWTEKIDLTTMIRTSGRIVFVQFLEELKTPKIHFEIYWPLASLLIPFSVKDRRTSIHENSCCIFRCKFLNCDNGSKNVVKDSLMFFWLPNSLYWNNFKKS